MTIWRSTLVAGAWSIATGLGAVVVWVGLHPVLDAAVPDRASALSAADVRKMAAPTTFAVPPSARASAVPPSTPPSIRPSRRAPAPAISASVVDGWTVTTKPDGTAVYVRSFHVAGGDAVIGMTPGQVYLISAAPRGNYTVQTSQPSQTRLVVQFVSGSLATLIDAIWWNGAPYAQVS
jgi:hypothetical protein